MSRTGYRLLLIHVQSDLLRAAVLRAATTRHYSSNGAVPALRAPIGDVGKALRYAVLLDAENAQHSALPLIWKRSHSLDQQQCVGCTGTSQS